METHLPRVAARAPAEVLARARVLEVGGARPLPAEMLQCRTVKLTRRS